MLLSITLFLSIQLLSGWPLHHQEGTPPPGPARSIPHTHERAGNPLEFRHHLETSKTSAGRGYYVGGGNFVHGDSRTAQEGTWGYDDLGGNLLPRRTRLTWNHGRRYQGGTGAYATDIEKPILGRKHEK